MLWKEAQLSPLRVLSISAMLFTVSQTAGPMLSMVRVRQLLTLTVLATLEYGMYGNTLSTGNTVWQHSQYQQYSVLYGMTGHELPASQHVLQLHSPHHPMV